MAGSGAGKFLRAVQLHENGAAGAQRHHRADVLEQDLLLATKPSAKTRLDHTNLADRNAEGLRDNSPAVERHLGGRADDDSAVRIKVRQRNVRFDRRVSIIVGFKFSAHHDVRFRQSFFDVAHRRFCPCSKVALRIKRQEARNVRLIMNDRRIRRKRLLRVQHRGENFVFDLN